MFPVQEPFNSFMLDAGNGHQLRVAEFGNPLGHPVVYLHGGPGGGFSPAWQKYFSPGHYRIILFDQRGCGGSTPWASTEDNSISTLIDDIENLRTHLGIDRWTIGGGSWGSTLAMLYSEKYPEHVTHMILRGVFYGTKDGAAHIAEAGGALPKISGHFEAYRDLALAQGFSADNLIAAYDQMMKQGDAALQTEAARRFMLWDTSIAFYEPADALPALEAIEQNPREEIPITKIFMHFALNEFRDEFRARLLQVPAFRTIPIDIIHGEDDRICPLNNAFLLAAAYPHARLHVCKRAGHSGGETSIIEAHVTASEAIRRRLENPQRSP